ncbi:MAG: isoprenylcysteine carboxylmethyltransferase family protein [Gammaproteobacteria bacterium]
MSHRTKDLPPLTGLTHAVRELRYHEASRQVLAIVLIAFFALVARPTFELLLIGTPLVLAGTGWRLYASGFISKNEQLATHGPYALVRHPLYTGNILIIIGFSITSGVWWTAPLALLFFFFYYPTAIEYEDRKLRRAFGPDWETWSTRIPALLPTFSNFSAVFEGGWSFKKSSGQNGEPIIVLFILFWLAYVVWRLP